MAQVEILRVGGGRELHELPKHRLMSSIQRLIGCACCDVVNLRDGRVMLVDDTGMVDNKPVNQSATAVYHRIYTTPYSIHGDAAIVLDQEFA